MARPGAPRVVRTGRPLALAAAVVIAWAVPAAAQVEPAMRPQDSGSASLLARTATDLGHGLADFAGDGWYVLTVPIRMDARDAGILAGVLGVGGLLYVWDEGLSDALQRQDGNPIHDGLREIGDFVGLMGNTNRWYALGLLAGYVSGWDPLLHVSRDLLASHWIAAATYNPPRRWIGRTRPEDGQGAREFGGGTSLPSGHASSIVQVAAVLSHHVGWRPAKVAIWGLAGTLLLQRVDSGKHWPSDVWIGAAWGYGVSRLVLARADARRSPVAAMTGGAQGIQVMPYVDGSTGRPGVAIHLPLGPRPSH
jgi:membrane-associated phospholipid phosphatase